MGAITLTPIEPVESFRIADKTSELRDRITAWFLAISELSIEGSVWPILLALAAFLLLVLGIYLGGWEHVAVGP